ncbi:MAG: hypothetical protein RLP09_43190 [Sandaracinaceae bacterium]
MSSGSSEFDCAAARISSRCLVDLPELRELLIEHYKSADLETRQLVPLRRLYWPVAIDD